MQHGIEDVRREFRGGGQLFVNEAWAQAPSAAPGGLDLMSMLPILLMFVVLYFLMLRPQMKRQKEHKALLDSLQKGDEVVTGGGMLGKVSKLTDNYVSVEVSDKVEITVQRASIQLVLPKGTLKNI